MNDATQTQTRAQRMLDALLNHGNRNAKMVLTVTLEKQGGGRFHQTFRLKAWDGRGGKMLTTDLMDGDWAAGTRSTKVTHTDVSAGRTWKARDAEVDALTVYAAEQAVRWAREGTVAQPANGTVTVVERDHCAACGRELDRPESIELGVGPECARRCGLDHHYRSSRTTTSRRPEQRTAADDAADGVDVFGEPVSHSLQQDLAGRVGRFLIRNGAVFQMYDGVDSRVVIEAAFRLYGANGLRTTVLDRDSGELVVEYDA